MQLQSANNGYTEELDEAILALKALGYSEKEIQKVAKEIRNGSNDD